MSEQKVLKIRELISAIRSNERFMIVTHVRPDGDAVGSLLATRLILQRLGKKADAYAQDRFPQEFEFLPGALELSNKPFDHSELGK